MKLNNCVIFKAMGSTWHPECFCCEMCHKELADLGFIKNQGRALCHECNAKVSVSSVIVSKSDDSYGPVCSALDQPG